MTEESKAAAKSKSSEVGTIREILMGDYIREYAATFDNVEAHFRTNEANFDARLRDLEERISNRILALEQKLEAEVMRIDSKIEQTNQSHKQKLSQLFTLLSAQIND